MIRLAFPAIALLTLAACAPKTPVTAIPGVECSAENVDSLIGKMRSAEVEAEAKRLSSAKVVRWVTPGMMVTMDFRADRLNLHLGADGKIASARCG